MKRNREKINAKFLAKKRVPAGNPHLRSRAFFKKFASMQRPETCALMISTYNWPDALKLVLESVLRQTRMPDEVLIADDGSAPRRASSSIPFAKNFPARSFMFGTRTRVFANALSGTKPSRKSPPNTLSKSTAIA